MELLLIKIVGLVRPLASMEFAEQVFSLLGVGLFFALTVAMLISCAIRQTLKFGVVDGLIIAFASWCVSIFIIYYDNARIADVMKLLIPVLSYTLVKSVVRTREEYVRLLWWMLAGFSIPTVLSATLILLESPIAVDMVNYWTKVTRWDGVYIHSHNLGHSMTLLLMVLGIVVAIQEPRRIGGRRAIGLAGGVALGALAIVALFCLYMSQVRTAIIGLFTFLAVFTFQANKKVFVLGSAGVVLLATITAPYWLFSLNPEIGVIRQGRELDVLDVGSGRPRFWLNDLIVFADLPLDRKLAGVGIGAQEIVSEGDVLYGHNDWLGILTQTGLIGLCLFVALQVAVARAILKLKGSERAVFLAMFAAVQIMMAGSNSYVWRIQVAHLYYMLLAFIELPEIVSSRAPPGVAPAVGNRQVTVSSGHG